ncbi:hypothetical protein [Thermobrachium celere]|uniref:Uncharacterized protein n=1 Tax=Thermobrachium celere DSM 8682 TaxID=941824 RepID=R7RRQ7_9CLOT|nr:hypothetical protein [Thermobrachium celere]CDF58026.1 hypothetical protein TCEL_01940 [Thermobrachium celere DSM 8682]
MPINPITLDKIDYHTIKQIQTKIIDRIVHETAQVEINRDYNKKNFNSSKQERAIEEFAKYLLKFNLKLNAEIKNKKIKVKILNDKGNVLIETYVDDLDFIFKNIQYETGNLIDIRG